MIEKILAYILECCNNNEFAQTTVANMSENLKIGRSQVSVVLNKLVKENKLVQYLKGIYYKPLKGTFGNKKLNINKVIDIVRSKF